MNAPATTQPVRTPMSYYLRFFRQKIVPVSVWIAAIVGLGIWSQQKGLYVEGVGIVEERQVSVSPVTDGVIRSLGVDLFGPIEEGQIVALMDDAVISGELLVAEAELAQLRLDLQAEKRRLDTELSQLESEALNDLRRFRMNEEEARLEHLDRTVEQETNTVKLERLRIQLNRQRDLVRQKIGSQDILDDTELQVAELKKKLVEDAKALEVAEKLLESATLRREEREAQTMASNADDFIAPLRQALIVQEARVSSIKQRRSSLVLRAPASGQVAHVYHRPGETVLAGDPVLAITESGSPRVLAYISERTASSVRPGNEVELQSRGRPGTTAIGQVARVGSSIQELPLALRSVPLFSERGFPILLDSIPEGVFLPGEPLVVRIKSTPGD